MIFKGHSVAFLPAPKDPRDPFVHLAVKEAYRTPWIMVEHHDVIVPDGSPSVYGIVRPTSLATGVLPIWDDGTVTLVGQWRVPLNAWSWEMPEGGVKDDDALGGAQRELAEETGLAAAHWLQVADLAMSNSISDERAIVFLAWGLTQAGEATPDATEVLEIIRVPFETLMAAIDAGEITDSLTVVTALHAERLARNGGLPSALAQVMLGK
jgi:8-oxo-dGTP pyrophosphatase MutT (NUDIX family)